MSLLQRYVFGRIVGTLTVTVLGVLLLVWVVQALQRVNLVTDGGTALASFLWIALLILPRVLTVVLPFALVIATVNALNAMNTDSETIVLNAAGAGRRIFVVPVLAIAALVTLVHLLTVHALEPASRQAFRTAIAESRSVLLSSLIREGQFRSLGDDLTVHIDARGPNGQMEGMLLSDRRDPKAERTYYARSAVVARENDVEFVLMRNGQVHSRDLGDGAIQVIEFSTYALDLSNLSQTDGNKPFLFPKDRSTTELLDPDPEDPVYLDVPNFFRAELHKRLSSWLYIWAFVAIALHAAARPRSTRETSASVMIFVLTTCLVARGVGFALEDAARKTPSLIPLLYLVPIGVAAAFGLAMWRDRRFLLPTAVRRLRNHAWDAGVERVARARRRLPFGIGGPGDATGGAT